MLDLIELRQILCAQIHPVGEHVVTEADQVITPRSQADIFSRGTHHLGVGCGIRALVLRFDDHIKLGEHEILVPVTLFDQRKAQILPSGDHACGVKIRQKLQATWTAPEDLSSFFLIRCVLIGVDEKVR